MDLEPFDPYMGRSKARWTYTAIWSRVTSRSVSVDTADGSCWVLAPETVIRLSATGEELWRGGSFLNTKQIVAHPSDGSCWVAFGGAVAHLDADGGEIGRGTGLSPHAISVDPADGSCWVADYYAGAIVHLGLDGGELGRRTGLANPTYVAVGASDGSCWIAEWDPLTPADDIYWDEDKARLKHFSTDGQLLQTVAGFTPLRAISVHPTDGSVWLGDDRDGRVVHISADGAELSQVRSPPASAASSRARPQHRPGSQQVPRRGCQQ